MRTWPLALRFILGASVGFTAWFALSPFYLRAITPVAAALLRLDSRFSATSFHVIGLDVESRDNVPPARIPASLLTYNVILLAALYSMNAETLRDRNVSRFLASLVVLGVGHVLGLVAAFEAMYGYRLAWGAQHYSTFERNAWLAADQFYRLIGMFAFAFACWWWPLQRPQQGLKFKV